MTSPLTISSRAGGTRVVLPAPGGASTTRLGERLRDAIISGRIASTGSTGLLITNFHRNTPHGKRQRRFLNRSSTDLNEMPPLSLSWESGGCSLGAEGRR